MEAETAKYIAKALIILSMLATAPAEAWVAAKAMEAIGRNPGVGDSIFPKMIVGMAICESTAIYALVAFFII
jgi:F-type H+-transporting ATPase subunit c